MRKIIKTSSIEKAVYELCLRANIKLPESVYKSLKALSKKQKDSNKIKQILKNAYLAQKNQRPLCQDTGQVVVFLEIGQEVSLKGDLLDSVINRAVAKAYEDFSFRKSVVKDALERVNTQDNTPVIIHTEIVEGNSIKVDLLIKGAGSENMSAVKMLKPSDGVDGVIDFVKETIENAGESACPPMHIGIGIGGTIERSAILAKKALIKPFEKDSDLENQVLKEVNKVNEVFKVSVLTTSTHIASLPISLNINCHSARHSSCEVFDKEVIFEENNYPIEDYNLDYKGYKKIKSDDVKAIKNLKKGEKVLLSGIVYTARDMAHQRLFEAIEKGKKLPFDIENSIIFYAGPCPKKEGEVIGPIGPTTSSRMDKFTSKLIEEGLLATIGKGSRSKAVEEVISKNKTPYFSTTGGVASLLANCVKKSEVVAYEDLGAESIFKLEVKDLPLIVKLN